MIDYQGVTSFSSIYIGVRLLGLWDFRAKSVGHSCISLGCESHIRGCVLPFSSSSLPTPKTSCLRACARYRVITLLAFTCHGPGLSRKKRLRSELRSAHRIPKHHLARSGGGIPPNLGFFTVPRLCNYGTAVEFLRHRGGVFTVPWWSFYGNTVEFENLKVLEQTIPASRWMLHKS